MYRSIGSSMYIGVDRYIGISYLVFLFSYTLYIYVNHIVLPTYYAIHTLLAIVLYIGTLCNRHLNMDRYTKIPLDILRHSGIMAQFGTICRIPFMSLSTIQFK